MVNKVKRIDYKLVGKKRSDESLQKVKTQPNVAYDIFLSSLRKFFHLLILHDSMFRKVLTSITSCPILSHAKVHIRQKQIYPSLSCSFELYM